MLKVAAIASGLAAAPVGWLASDDGTFTLYRDSVMDSHMRIHVATFDADDGADYNAENCNLAAKLFKQQEGVKTRFWCEKGRYRK